MAVHTETVTLVAATVTTVTLTRQGRAYELAHHGNTTDPVYVRTDGTAPTVAGAECRVLLMGERITVAQSGPTSTATRTCKLISAGIPTVTVSVRD